MTETNKKRSVAYTFRFFRSIEEAKPYWDIAAPANDIFLQSPYLSIVENYPPQGMRFGYVVYFDGEYPIGISYFQIKYFKADDNINEDAHATKETCFFSGLTLWLKRWVAGKVAAETLIHGNLLLTGEHAYHFGSQTSLSKTQKMQLLEDGLVHVHTQMEQAGVKMPFILIKDSLPTNKPKSVFYQKKKYIEFEIQPNMLVPISWSSKEEYLSAMATKYRTRAKRAFKKKNGLTHHSFSAEEIKENLPTIYSLYKAIATNAGFNMVDLNPEYLYQLKHQLGDAFQLYAYKKEGEIVAFYTTIDNHHEMEAHFIGYEKSANHHHQIYLNMLYDMVNHAISGGFQTLVFGRTALEIKSSVGAVPQPLFCYLRHHRNFGNQIAEKVLDYLKPAVVWRQRHPFKEGEGDDHGEDN